MTGQVLRPDLVYIVELTVGTEKMQREMSNRTREISKSSLRLFIKAHLLEHHVFLSYSILLFSGAQGSFLCKVSISLICNLLPVYIGEVYFCLVEEDLGIF